MREKQTITMKKTVLEDFGLTEQEYSQLASEYARLQEAISSLELNVPITGLSFSSSLLLIALTAVVSFGFFAWAVGLGIGLVLENMNGLQIINICGIVGVSVFVFIVLIIGLTVRYTAEKKLRKYRKELTNPQYEKVAQYKEAYKRFERTQQDYWKSLRGTKFERALANLYKQMGFSVQQTKASGDEGIDLILSKDNKTIIVQCKGHNKPVGVGVVRDLYGTMMHFGANSAVLACPAGFTEGVIRFVMNKPIQLISAIELIKMAESKQEQGYRRI